MSEGSNGNRPGSGVSRLDRPEELWNRLREATKEARAMAVANRQLSAQVATLERQQIEARRMSDDELVAELPRRMSRALESAQEVAEELVARARKREAVIRQKTDQRATALISHAEAEATAILRRAAGEAVGRVTEAKAQAQAIVRAAQTHHDETLADLQNQAAILDERMRQLHREHNRLTRAYEALERTFGDARAALRASVEADEPRARSPERESGKASAVPLYAVENDGAVYDWSPPASGTA